MAGQTGVLPFLISLLGYILLGPFFILTILVNEIIRLAVTIYLRLKYSGDIWLVPDGNDGVWSTRRPQNTRMILNVGRYKGKISRESLLNVYNEKMRTDLDTDGNLAYSKLEYILINKLGYPCWEQDKNFNMENHIRVLDQKVYNKAELNELLQQLSEDMDPRRPQWEMVLVPRYKEEGDMGETGWMITRLNHAYMDGISVLLTLKRFLSTNFTFYLDPITFEIPTWKRFLYYTNSVIYGPHAMLTLLKDKGKQYWPTLSSWEEPTVERNYRWTGDVDFDHIRKIRHATDKMTIQAIVQNAFISAAAQVLPRKRIPDEWVICELAALLPYKDHRPQNRFTGFTYTINALEEDFTRLRESKKAAWEGMTGPFIPMVYFLVSIVGRMPAFTHNLFLLKGAFSTLAFSNVPLSKTKVSLVDNVEGLEMFGYPPQPNDTGITLFSSTYVNNLTIAAVAKSNWIRGKELEEIMDRIPGIVEEWARIADKLTLYNDD